MIGGSKCCQMLRFVDSKSQCGGVFFFCLLRSCHVFDLAFSCIMCFIALCDEVLQREHCVLFPLVLSFFVLLN